MKHSPGARPVAVFPRASTLDPAARPCARRAAADPAARCAWAPALAAAVRLHKRKRTCSGRDTRGEGGHSAVRLTLAQGAPRETSRRPVRRLVLRDASRSAHHRSQQAHTGATPSGHSKGAGATHDRAPRVRGCSAPAHELAEIGTIEAMHELCSSWRIAAMVLK